MYIRATLEHQETFEHTGSPIGTGLGPPRSIVLLCVGLTWTLSNFNH